MIYYDELLSPVLRTVSCIVVDLTGGGGEVKFGVALYDTSKRRQIAQRPTVMNHQTIVSHTSTSSIFENLGAKVRSSNTHFD